tara:strand:- start:337 stop:576 length:240 start_codon:yes stop_codon:yes gene_type:complete
MNKKRLLLVVLIVFLLNLSYVYSYAAQSSDGECVFAEYFINQGDSCANVTLTDTDASEHVDCSTAGTYIELNSGNGGVI